MKEMCKRVPQDTSSEPSLAKTVNIGQCRWFIHWRYFSDVAENGLGVVGCKKVKLKVLTPRVRILVLNTSSTKYKVIRDHLLIRENLRDSSGTTVTQLDSISWSSPVVTTECKSMIHGPEPVVEWLSNLVIGVKYLLFHHGISPSKRVQTYR